MCFRKKQEDKDECVRNIYFTEQQYLYITYSLKNLSEEGCVLVLTITFRHASLAKRREKSVLAN